MHPINKTKREYLRQIYNELNKWGNVQTKLEMEMDELKWEDYYDAAFMIACLEEEITRIDSTQKRFWNRRIKETKKSLDIDDNLFEYILRVYSYPA